MVCTIRNRQLITQCGIETFFFVSSCWCFGKRKRVSQRREWKKKKKKKKKKKEREREKGDYWICQPEKCEGVVILEPALPERFLLLHRDCNNPCPGDNLQKCGGGNRIGVWGPPVFTDQVHLQNGAKQECTPWCGVGTVPKTKTTPARVSVLILKKFQRSNLGLCETRSSSCWGRSSSFPFQCCPVDCLQLKVQEFLNES